MKAKTKLLVGLTAAAVATGGVVIVAQVEPGEEPATLERPVGGPASSPSPSSSPERDTPALALRVGRVRPVSVGARIRRPRLRAAREGVARTIEELYTRGFLDPVWSESPAPRLDDLFAPEARKRPRRHRDALTLGDAAERLAAVRRPRVRVSMRVLTDRARRPMTVLANVAFEARGLGGGEEARIRHRAAYLLRPAGGRWRVVSYDVRGRIPPHRQIRRALEAPATRGGVFYLLVIGSDARPGERVAGARADSLHIVGVNFRRGRAGIVGIPRDSFVPIPGVGTRKINESLVQGGPRLAVRTVERLSGIRIDAYVLTGFQGFRSAVSGIGGIRTVIPYAMSDAASEAYFRPGRKRLGGPQALAFSRNRHDAPGGDFGRSLNQGRLILSALREFRSDLRRDPSTLLRWLVAGARHVDTDLSLRETIGLLLATTTIEQSHVRNVVVSGSGGMVGGQSVVHLGSGAQRIFRDLRGDGILNGT